MYYFLLSQKIIHLYLMKKMKYMLDKVFIKFYEMSQYFELLKQGKKLFNYISFCLGLANFDQ